MNRRLYISNMKRVVILIGAVLLFIYGSAQKTGALESFTLAQLRNSKVLNSINYHVLTSSKMPPDRSWQP